MFSDEEFIKEYFRRKEKYGKSDKEIAVKLSTNIKNLKRFEKGAYSPTYKFLETIVEIFDGNLKILFDDKNTISFSEEIINWFDAVKSKTGDSYDEIVKKIIKSLFLKSRNINPEEKMKEDFEIWEEVYKKLQEEIMLQGVINKADIKKYLHIIKNSHISEIKAEKFNFNLKGSKIKGWYLEEYKSKLQIKKLIKLKTDHKLSIFSDNKEKIGSLKINYVTKILCYDDKVKNFLEENEQMQEAFVKKIVNNDIFEKLKKDIKNVLKSFDFKT